MAGYRTLRDMLERHPRRTPTMDRPLLIDVSVRSHSTWRVGVDQAAEPPATPRGLARRSRSSGGAVSDAAGIKEYAMSEWNATTFEAKPNLLSVVRQQANDLLATAGEPDAWEAPTACPQW